MSIKSAKEQSPLVSVLITSYEPDGVLVDCLNSLRRQVTAVPFEIILVDSSSRFDVRQIASEYPDVQVIRVNHRCFCGEARNIGLSQVRGRLIAFLDADCEAAPDWIDRMVAAHRSNHPAIGGAIANGNPHSYVGWAAYFCEFSQWMPGSSPRLLKDSAGANMSYKKEILLRYMPFLTGTYCSDSEFHWRLWRDGHRLFFSPEMIVRHHNITSLRKYLLHEYHHGNCFGRVRLTGEEFSALRRWFHITFFFLLPFWRMSKLVYFNVKDRTCFLQMAAALPLIIPGVISWCLGETAGLLAAKPPQSSACVQTPIENGKNRCK